MSLGVWGKPPPPLYFLPLQHDHHLHDETSSDHSTVHTAKERCPCFAGTWDAAKKETNFGEGEDFEWGILELSFYLLHYSCGIGE